MMRRLLVSLGGGVVTGALIAAVTFPWLARTAAIAMPRTFNVYLWDALVVFGLGASLVAFPLMLLALRLIRARGAEVAAMLVAAMLAVVAALKVVDALDGGGSVLLAWAVGMLLAALVHGFWRPSPVPQSQAMPG
ncbi:hypothetical protein FJU31_08045 [Stenotrophomonas cyclobalanopsidis]|uniref:Uncharacterized protein n=1 Tax=Stenotrophomonas cyclobalanopsidis TaxID=2771362 RepID=A0ABQ6T253_9GAMM|nr:hypothetical protein [Stenotrophomonas cyclobalanopsidis]KAA9000289.1 hypothetical protein FJU31_08045 [Stenotrophomonas cyclobalanopsidis]